MRPTTAFRVLTYMQVGYLILVPLAGALILLVPNCLRTAQGVCPPVLFSLAGLAAPGSILSVGLSSPYLIPLAGLSLFMGLKLLMTANAVGDRPAARRLRWHLLIPLGTILVTVVALVILTLSGLAVVLLAPGGLVWG